MFGTSIWWFIMKHAGDLAQAVCVWQFFQLPTRHGPYEVSNEGEERWQWRPRKLRRSWPRERFWVSWPTSLRWRRADISKVLKHIDWDRHPGGEEVWQVRSPWLVHDSRLALRQLSKEEALAWCFGKEVKIRPQPAKTVVKAFPVSQLKSQIWGHGWFAKFGHGAVAKEC